MADIEDNFNSRSTAVRSPEAGQKHAARLTSIFADLPYFGRVLPDWSTMVLFGQKGFIILRPRRIRSQDREQWRVRVRRGIPEEDEAWYTAHAQGGDPPAPPRSA